MTTQPSPSPSAHPSTGTMWRTLHTRLGSAVSNGSPNSSNRLVNWQDTNTVKQNGPSISTNKYEPIESSNSSPRISNRWQQTEGRNCRIPGQSSNRYLADGGGSFNKWQQLEANVGRAAYSYCRFCQNNGESAEIFLSHVTKESSGTVRCPILRSYTCPVCGQTGDRAHTVSYCPRNRTGGSGVGDRKTARLDGKWSDKENDALAIPTPMAGHLINMNTKE